ncbi:hypothetical protein KSP39_PZI022722 [Platanthera zijinensis]|uniref:Uncharacterized protein n=1 Tax=Platanthera zijinensis TaxID=2320716 RepID=A0AAP0AWE8_9ASPA
MRYSTATPIGNAASFLLVSSTSISYTSSISTTACLPESFPPSSSSSHHSATST